METLEDDRAELENYSVRNWQPVKIISMCYAFSRCTGEAFEGGAGSDGGGYGGWSDVVG